MTVYYQLENMLVSGFKSKDEYKLYIELKKNYEAETQDYSFSIREITNQLEVIIENRDNVFPYLDDVLVLEYTTLIEKLKEYDGKLAEKYMRRLDIG